MLNFNCFELLSFTNNFSTFIKISLISYTRLEKHSNLQYSTTEVMTMTILTLLMTGIVTLELMVGFAEPTEIVSGLIQILNVMIDDLPSAKSRYDN